MADRRAFARLLRELEQGEPAPWDPSESLARAVAVLGGGEGDMEIIGQLARRTGIAIERTRRTLGIREGAAVDGGQQQRA
jgi:hypothetical protein